MAPACGAHISCCGLSFSSYNIGIAAFLIYRKTITDGISLSHTSFEPTSQSLVWQRESVSVKGRLIILKDPISISGSC